MGKIIFSYGKYGDKQVKKEPTQSLWIRIFHSSLDYRRSLKMDISREGFDFNTNHITDLQKGTRTQEESIYLQSVKEELQEIEKVFHREFLILKNSRRLISFNTQDWKEWSAKVVEEGRGGAIADRIFLKDKMEEYKDLLISEGKAEGTIKGWIARIKMLEAFEKDFSHRYYTDEIDLKFWQKSMDWVVKNNNKPSYHGEFIKKIKATYHHFSPLNSDNTEWNGELNHDKFRITKSKKRDDNFILLDDWNKIVSYNDKGYLNNMRDLAIIQYQACLRYSELKGELDYYQSKGKFKHIEKKGDKYFWSIKEIKNSNREKDKVKTIPVHPSIVKMIESNSLPHIISPSKANEYIKELAKELEIVNGNEITTHTIRHSKITHLISLGVPDREVKMLSGHSSDSSFQGYNHDRVDLDNHSLPMD